MLSDKLLDAHLPVFLTWGFNYGGHPRFSPLARCLHPVPAVWPFDRNWVAVQESENICWLCFAVPPMDLTISRARIVATALTDADTLSLRSPVTGSMSLVAATTEASSLGLARRLGLADAFFSEPRWPALQ